jgi:hypothetical protein
MTSKYSSISESNNLSLNDLDSQDSAIFRQSDKTNQSGTFSTGFSNQQPILEMPKALDYRNFMEFPRLQDEIRFKLFNSLKFDKNSNFSISFCTFALDPMLIL